MRNYGEITYRYLKGQKKRTLLTIMGIILSVALITSIGTMVISARDMMIQNEIKRNGDYHAIFTDTPGEQVQNIENYTDIEKSWLTNQIGIAALGKTSDQEQEDSDAPPYRYVDIRGYDQDAFINLPITLKDGRLPKNDGEILLEYWLPDYMPGNLKIGDVITLPIGIRIDEKGNELSVNSWANNEIFEEKDARKYTVVGFFQPSFVSVGQYMTRGITFLDRKSLSADEHYNVYIKMTSVKGVTKKAEQIAQSIELPQLIEDDGSSHYNIQYNNRLLRLSAQSVNVDVNNSLISILISVVILIMVSTIAVIYNAFHISVLERISQFGVLRCVGASPKQIKNIVLKEAMILSIISIPIGLICGVLAMQIVMYFVGKFNFDLFEGLTILVSPMVFIVSAVIGFVTVFLSALGPAKQASRIPALEAVRNTGNFKKESFDKIKKSSFSRRLLGVEGEIAYKNLKRNSKRFKITLFSMIISIVLYIVFSSFMSYILKANNINSSEMGDFMIWNNGGSSEQKEFDDSIYRDLRKLSSVDKVFYYQRYSAQMLVPDDKMNPKFVKSSPFAKDYKRNGFFEIYNNELYGYEDENLDAFKPLLKKGDINIDALNKENGVLIVQTSHIQGTGKAEIMDIVDYKIGDEITITADSSDEDPEYYKLKIFGILERNLLEEPYNLNDGTIIITTKDVYKRIKGTEYNPILLIIAQREQGLETIREYLKVTLDQKPSYTYIDRAKQAEENRNVAATISIFLYGFVVVITLIGSLNIINTISANLLLRTKELSMLKAIGMTKNGIKKMVSIEATLYGVIASIYGSIIGTGLSYLLYHFISDGLQDFPWVAPWRHILISVTGATLIALLSGYLPLRNINHKNIVDNMRMEE